MHRRLTVAWFDRWADTLDDALAELPAAATCPHELFRELAVNPGPVRKRTALVTSRDRPVAVVAVREAAQGTWEPVTQWIVPGVVCPAADGFLMPALDALKLDLVVAWWRMGDVPDHRSFARVERSPVHRLRLAEREAYWRTSSHWTRVQRARRKCAALEVSIDVPGVAEWVIRHWAEKWQVGGGIDVAVEDRVLAASHLEREGLLRTIALSAEGRFVAGSTNIRHEDTLTAGLLFRDETVGSLPTGVRLIDLAFEVAERDGLTWMDMGGGYDYKRSWAPVSGERAKLFLQRAPRPRPGARVARRLRAGVRTVFGSATGVVAFA